MMQPRSAVPMCALLNSAVVVFALAGQAALAVEAVVPAAAQPDDREAIAKARAEAQARYSDRDRECRTHFIVTSCLEEAKRERRQTLDQLRARQLMADEARRRQRTDERKAELSAKAAEDAKRDAERAGSATRSTSPAASEILSTDGLRSERRPEPVPPSPGQGASASKRSSRPSAPAVAVKPDKAAQAREAREASSRAAFELRQRQAAEHRGEVAERVARQTAEKKPSAPLPVASAASASLRAASRP